MAITINTTPDDFNAAYRPVIWEVDSDDVTIVRIIADVYVNNVYETTIEKDPNIGTTDEFKFDIQRVCQDLLSHDFDTSIIGVGAISTTNSSKNFKLRMFEVLDTGSGFTTTWLEDGAGTGYEEASNVFVTNTTLQHTETQDLNAFTVETSAKRWLTNRPTSGTQLIKGDPFFLDALTEQTIDFRRTETDGGGSPTVVDTALVFNPAFGKVQVSIDTNQFSTDTVTVDYILRKNLPAGDLSQTQQVNVIQNCLDDTFTLYWQNPLGGIDSQPFRGRKIEGIASEIVTHRKILADDFNVEDRGETVLDHMSDDLVRAWTEVNNKATMRWLREIGLTGRNAWIYDNGFVPVIVTDFTEQVVDTDNYKGRFEVEFRFANRHIAQRG